MRWTVTRKEQILNQIKANPEQTTRILSQYNMSPEELAEWSRLYSLAGRSGLKAKSLHFYQPDRRPKSKQGSTNAPHAQSTHPNIPNSNNRDKLLQPRQPIQPPSETTEQTPDNPNP